MASSSGQINFRMQPSIRNPDSDMAPFTSVFRASEPRKVKRNRQALSCTACQKRKSRCDRRQPCSTCEKRGDEATCRFGSVASGSATGAGVTVGGRAEVQNRLSKLEELVKGLAEQPMPGPWNTSSTTSSSGSNHPSTESSGSAHGPPRANSTARRTSQQGEFNYSGPTSWSALVESIRDIQSVLMESEEDVDDAYVEDEGEPGDDSVANGNAPDAVFGEVPSVSIDEILRMLPPRQDTDKLITAYFNSKFMAVPFIHTQHFKRRYDRFWDAPESMSLLWISTMFSIMSCGVLIVKMKNIVMSAPEALSDSKTYTHMAIRCLVAGRYLQAKPGSVEALVMLAHSCNIQKQDSDAAIWTLYALAIRLAQRQGYHRDATKITFKITPFEAEMRRRVWFILESYDLLFSYQQGMPPMIHEDLTDAGHMLVLADEDFDEDSVQLIPRAPVDPLPCLAYQTKSRMLPLFRRMMRHALGTKRESFDNIRHLGVELDQWYASVPSCLRYRTIRETSFTDHNYTIFHRIMLESMYHMNRCMLYRSFLLGQGINERCQIALGLCRDSALRMLDIHFDVDREIQPGGRLYEDRFMVSSLTLHGFLMAAMIICLELNDSDNMSIETRRHRIDILHAAHQMWVDRSSTSAEARHASRVLRAILNRVDTPNTTSSGSQPAAPATPNAPVRERYPVPMASQSQPQQQQQEQQKEPPSHMVVDMPQADGTAITLDFDQLLPLESFFGEQEGLNWNYIDKYLRPDRVDEMLAEQPLPDMQL